MEERNIGAVVMLIGAVVIAAGFLLSRGWLGWFGRLPGDIRIVSDSTRIYFPITSMILVSVVLTIAVNLFRRFW